MKRGFSIMLVISLVLLVSKSYSYNYNELKKSDFFKFFNVKEIERKKISNTDYELSLKTGGFQQFIDISLIISSNEKIKSATLTVSRQWIGNYENRLNPFAKDITKSFIFELTPGPDKLLVMDLVNGIFNITGKKDRIVSLQGREKPEVIFTDGLKVFLGILDKTELKNPECILKFENKILNGKLKFIVSIINK